MYFFKDVDFLAAVRHQIIAVAFPTQHQKTIQVSGADLPQAVLEFVRNNDVAVLEACDKVRKGWTLVDLVSPSSSML